MTSRGLVTVYTDGACKSREGGWAALVLGPEERKVLSGKASDTTSNRMELSAAINALESLPMGSEVTLFSDSEYLIKTMTLGWRRNANLDLWQRLDTLSKGHQLKWQWVQGHNGDPGNEFVNALAGYEAGVTKNRPHLDRYLTKEATGEPASDPGLSLTHLDDQGRVNMVDVGGKPTTDREAVARGWVSLQPETLRLLREGLMKKGDVLTTAQLAGIMGAKRTAELIPLCHPLPLNRVDVELGLDEGQCRVNITATASTSAKTGVEMEALTAVSVAALTIYDMCKAVDRGMRIEGIRLVSKRGGQSGDIVLED